jgi:hypothetical protein
MTEHWRLALSWTAIGFLEESDGEGVPHLEAAFQLPIRVLTIRLL